MIKKRSLKEIFKIFVNKEVGVSDYVGIRLNDPEGGIVDQMKAVAQKNGLTLQISLPNTIHSLSIRDPNRVNVRVEKDPKDKKWKVTGFDRG